MAAEGREQVTRTLIIRVNGQPEELDGSGGRRQPSMGGTSRVTGDGHARICEGLGVQVPGATRPKAGQVEPAIERRRRYSFTRRTKMLADGTVRRNNA